MPKNWRKYKLGDAVISANTGLDAIKRAPITEKDTGIKCLRIQDVSQRKEFNNWGYCDVSSENYKKFALREGEIIIARTGNTIGVNQYINEDLRSVFNNGLIRLRIKKDMFFPKYIYYNMRSLSFQNYIYGIAYGTSTQPNMQINSLLDFELFAPPLPEQTAIASILSALDDKIELNLQQNKTLEEMAMALYKHWFVDFGPFKDGNFIDSELGRIPEGWEVKKLGEIIQIKHGFAFKGDFFVNENRQELLLTPGNFSKNGGIQFNWSKQKFYSGEFPKEYSLKKGDLLIALTDLTQSCEILGAPALIPDNDYNYLHNQRLGLVELKNEKYSNEILYCLANTYEYREFVKNSKTGSTVSHSAPTRIYDYKIVFPSNLDLSEIKETLRNLLEQINLNLTENKLLTNHRDSLLPKLISGEIRVKNLKNNLKEVL